jgi:hypothetical protein
MTFGWREFSVDQDTSMSVKALSRIAGRAHGVSAAWMPWSAAATGPEL